MAKAKEKTELEELEDMYRKQMDAEDDTDEDRDDDEPDTDKQDEENDDDLSVDDEEEEDGGQDDDEEDDRAEIEAKARRAGWKPEAEYKGKDPWVDAEEFLERAEKDSREMRRQNQNLQRTLEKLEKNVEALNKHHEREITAREDAAYERGRKSYEEVMQKAAKEGDTETYNKAMRGRDELMRTKHERENKAEDDPEEDKKQDPPPPPNNWNRWAKDNPWFETDAVLTDAAKKQCGIYAAQGKSPEEQLKLVHDYIRETYPHKFYEEDDNEPRNSRINRRKAAPRMPGGSRRPASKSIEPDSYEALKPKYKAECDRTLKANPKMQKEDFLRYCSPDMFTITNQRED